jgi:hypothetical protein
MISLGPSSTTFDADLLDSPGGFVWWYADMLDEEGNGCVLIWSFGLPFLPGYLSAARDGSAPRAGNRPSLNICIYRQGNLDFYLLQEYPGDEVGWQGTGEWRFGDTVIQSATAGARHQLTAEIDCQIPGTDDRLTGNVSMDGPGVKRGDEVIGTDEQPDHAHEWRLLTANADATANLACEQTSYQMQGRGYHDCNGGRRPFHDLGIGYWIWGRVEAGGTERIFYALWPDQGERHQSPKQFFDNEPHVFGLTVDASGAIETVDELSIRSSHSRTSLGGMPWWREMTLNRGDDPWMTVTFGEAVDSGPFYMRFILDAGEHSGMGECIAPHRIDLARYRPLVNMRVDRIGRRNSMWLPLFSGPQQGRVQRLFGQWW